MSKNFSFHVGALWCDEFPMLFRIVTEVSGRKVLVRNIISLLMRLSEGAFWGKKYVDHTWLPYDRPLIGLFCIKGKTRLSLVDFYGHHRRPLSKWTPVFQWLVSQWLMVGITCGHQNIGERKLSFLSFQINSQINLLDLSIKGLCF